MPDHLNSEARTDWDASLDDELGFWRETFAAPPPDFLDRLDPERRFRDDEAVVHLARGGRLRVLDVGSGPLSVFGYTHPDCRIDLFPTDPLAHAYVRLLREHGFNPPVLPLRIEAERLPDVFPGDYFDCAYALNALDHCYDPTVALAKMLEVVRPEGVVSLVHLEHVGRLENYTGLHQWDFYVEGERALLANRDRSRVHDLGEHFAATAELIVCERGEEDHPEYGRAMACRLRFLKRK